MILSESRIQSFIEQGIITIEPEIRDEQIQPASLDVRLGSELFDVDSDLQVSLTRDGNFVFEPETRYLGHTQDHIDLPNGLGAQLVGRSSVGRQGLIIHKTAGWIDPGFTGEITLELYNMSNEAVIFEPGTRIGQLVFMQVFGETDGYDGKYQNQTGAVHSR